MLQSVWLWYVWDLFRLPYIQARAPPLSFGACGRPLVGVAGLLSKLLVWVLVIGVAYSLLVPSVTLNLPNITEASHSIPPEITKSARGSFEQLSGKLGMWALAYMDKLISSLREEEEGYDPFQFHNLTRVLQDTRLSVQPTSGNINVARSLVDMMQYY